MPPLPPPDLGTVRRPDFAAQVPSDLRKQKSDKKYPTAFDFRKRCAYHPFCLARLSRISGEVTGELGGASTFLDWGFP